MIDIPQPKKPKHQPCPHCKAPYPYHFLECLGLPGGEDLYEENYKEEQAYREESVVDRDQGVRILKAIFYMISAPNTNDFDIRKEAVFKEINQLGGDSE